MQLEDEQVVALAAALQNSMPEQIKGKLKADASKLFDEFAMKVTTLSKDAICEHSWALLQTYEVSPKLPIHVSSLFKVFSKVLPEDSPEARVWLVTYDYKALTQHLWHELLCNLVWNEVLPKDVEES